MSDTASLVALLVAGGVQRAYPMGAVPASPAYPYAVVGRAPAPPQVRTLDGSGDRVGQFVVQHFGRSVASVEALADLTFAAFDGEPVGDGVAWQESASTVYRDPDDDGVLTVTHTYRY